MSLAEAIMEVLEFYADASAQSLLSDGGKRAGELKARIESFANEEHEDAISILEAYAESMVANDDGATAGEIRNIFEGFEE